MMTIEDRKSVACVLQFGPLNNTQVDIDMGLPYVDLPVPVWNRPWEDKENDRLARYTRTRDGSRIYRFNRMVSNHG